MAINKIDKPDADPNRVRTELLQHEIVVEIDGRRDARRRGLGAKKQTNLDKLLEAILLQAEVLDLKANPEPPGRGHRDRGQARPRPRPGRDRAGPARHAAASATSSSPAPNGAASARSIDERGEQVDEAGPSMPVEVLGFDGAPEAGDRFAVVENEARAREVTDYRARQKRENAAARGRHARARSSR